MCCHTPTHPHPHNTYVSPLHITLLFAPVPACLLLLHSLPSCLLLCTEAMVMVLASGWTRPLVPCAWSTPGTTSAAHASMWPWAMTKLRPVLPGSSIHGSIHGNSSSSCSGMGMGSPQAQRPLPSPLRCVVSTEPHSQQQCVFNVDVFVVMCYSFCNTQQCAALLLYDEEALCSSVVSVLVGQLLRQCCGCQGWKCTSQSEVPSSHV